MRALRTREYLNVAPEGSCVRAPVHARARAAMLPSRLINFERAYDFRMRTLSACLFFVASTAFAVEPIPDKLLVLTFDDASKSHDGRARAAEEVQVRRNVLRHRRVRLSDQQARLHVLG